MSVKIIYPDLHKSTKGKTVNDKRKHMSNRKFRVLFIPFTFGLTLSLVSCAANDRTVDVKNIRYRVKVLAVDVDPNIILDRLAADFDEDGHIDRIIWSPMSLEVRLSGGGMFQYTVGEMPEDSATRLNDVKAFSLNRDGSHPSIFMALERKTPERWVEPIRQKILFNDAGHLVLKRLINFPIVAQSLDCAWLASNKLPVCFYAGCAGTAKMGFSQLIELDPEGIWNRAHNSEYLAFRNQVGRYDGWFKKDHPSAKEHVLAMRDIDPETIDSLLAEGWTEAAKTLRDEVLCLFDGLADRGNIYCNDITREYGLPWPVELSMAYDQQEPSLGRWNDGYMMLSTLFTDFTGDGLLDLVVVGQHSAVFSAVQTEDGTFVHAKYHGLPDEYARVSGPKLAAGENLTVPPCVYYGLERRQASREEYVECYDQMTNEWYEVSIPDGPYRMGLKDVMFWDMNHDGMIDFAARRSDGSWNLLTFEQELNNAMPRGHTEIVQLLREHGAKE
jgi:hypothetical protein